jgi:hypothetical protein
VELKTTKKRLLRNGLERMKKKQEIRTDTTIQKLSDFGRQHIMKDWLHRVD